MHIKKRDHALCILKKNWIGIIGVIIGAISIIFSFTPDLTKYALTAFMLSIFTLFHDQYSRTQQRLENVESHSSQMSIDVKNHLKVIRLDKPTHTFNNYVMNRLNIIKSIKNTSFNCSNHHEADEYFNNSSELQLAPSILKEEVKKGLKWFDIGDNIAKNRFSYWYEQCSGENKSSSFEGSYDYLIFNNKVPYPNFLIITYKDESEEILFNWDFRTRGYKPDVLVSSEKELVQFYSAQFELLRENASPDSDRLP